MFDYEMVYSYILNLIETELNENDKIPSEKALCEKFGITRATARQGIAKLKNEGFIYSKKGSGCFVSMQKIQYELSPFTTFTDQIIKAGKTPSLKVVRPTIIKNKKISKILGISSDEEILQVTFVRYVDDSPFLVTKSYLNMKKLPNVQKYLAELTSLTKLFQEKYNINPIRKHSELEIIPNRVELEDMLTTGNNLPIIKISSSSIDSNDQQVVEYCQSYFRSDIAKIVINYNGEKKW